MISQQEGRLLPEISEFSYGFALTNELVGWLELSVAPIFPSLIEEGKIGGGYDVKLDRPGAPLYLQFKRSEYMVRSWTKECRIVRDQRGQLNVPFFRFPVRSKVGAGSKHPSRRRLLQGSRGRWVLSFRPCARRPTLPHGFSMRSCS
jgi:hypothetical protein